MPDPRLALALSLVLPAAEAWPAVKKPPADPFCLSAEQREVLKKKYKDNISRPDCAAALRKLSLSRLDCSEPQTIRDFKSAMLATIGPDDAYAEGFARALCPGKADAACMNPEPQCRLRSPASEPLPNGSWTEAFKARVGRFYLGRLKDISAGQARTMADHYAELHGAY